MNSREREKSSPEKTLADGYAMVQNAQIFAALSQQKY